MFLQFTRRLYHGNRIPIFYTNVDIKSGLNDVKTDEVRLKESDTKEKFDCENELWCVESKHKGSKNTILKSNNELLKAEYL
jgi:hypothetical protein